MPTAPAHLPERLQKKWVETHDAALKQAQLDNPEQPAGVHARTALTAANKLVKVEEPANYSDAQRLVKAFQEGAEDGWKIIAHGTRRVKGVDHLSIVTANGKRHLFPVPSGKQAAAPAAPTAPVAPPAA